MSDNVNNLSERVKNLSKTDKKILLKAFDSAKTNYSNTEAFGIAYDIIKHSNDVNVSPVPIIARSDLFLSPDYYYDAVLSSTSINVDGLIADDKLLQSTPITQDGDYDHIGLKTGNFIYKGLFKLIKSVYKDGKLYLRFIPNKLHSMYNEFKEMISNNNSEIGLSAEFIGAVKEDNKIVKAESIDWSVLIKDKPANNDAKVFAKKKRR
jgi:hypothetical protein